jgi:hypothetical protein
MTKIPTALIAAILLAACAETNAPLPEPVEVLLVVNQNSATLSLIPVDQPAAAADIPLNTVPGAPTGIAARDSIAVVPLGTADAVAIVDLRGRALLRTIALPPGSGATGAAIVSDSVAYVGNPGRASITKIDIWTGDTAEVTVGGAPQGLAFARGRTFVLNGEPPTISLTPALPSTSWITVVDPATNARATGVDSISLTGSGSAQFADLGSDGLLYVISPGPPPPGEGRLSIIDPVGRTEVASFAGIGAVPGNPASDGDERIFISSRTEGLMVFDIHTRTVTRGAGNGVAIPTNSAVAIDGQGRVYAIEAGTCTVGNTGQAHVLDAQLVELRILPLGECPIAAVIAKVP